VAQRAQINDAQPAEGKPAIAVVLDPQAIIVGTSMADTQDMASSGAPVTPPSNFASRNAAHSA